MKSATLTLLMGGSGKCDEVGKTPMLSLMRAGSFVMNFRGLPSHSLSEKRQLASHPLSA
jgi:hypothetical protein